ncbi:hypothetical protein ACWGB8_03765 [Kitasatospora sp. NPDC054939]
MIGVGDCVYKAVAVGGLPAGRETRCDGTGGRRPECKVAKVYTVSIARNATPESCPPGTAYEFSLRADDRVRLGPIACTVPV